ncbi:hypothetical protein AMJ51_00370 [Microgenomates bacterium DG_75]|nr:MAG: hypothetical protein AMJ51_00370 [Microgenomates bacterium DG_75]
MDWKHGLAKLTSILLIGMGLWQVFYSTGLLLFVYPSLKFGGGDSSYLLYVGLIEKAIVNYLAMIISGVYGVTLLFKPKEKLTYFQIAGGLVIFGFTVFFVTRTPVTTDPFIELFIKFIGR